MGKGEANVAVGVVTIRLISCLERLLGRTNSMAPLLSHSIDTGVANSEMQVAKIIF